MNEENLALLQLHLGKGVGRTHLFRLREFFGDFRTAARAGTADWRKAGVSAATEAQRISCDAPVLQQQRRYLEAHQVFLLTYWDQAYPQLLREIHDPPAVLYVQGQLPTTDCFAIVGSRRASAPGMLFSKELAATLAQHDVCIVSGLARGIDSAAHHGALHGGGKTVAVLGCGIDIVYPRENRPLHERITSSGAVISEHAPGTPPLSGNFPGRNRIISGLCKGVLVVEASPGSGSLITGDFALEQGRELFAVPGPVHHNNSGGTNQLLKEGAQLVTEAADILTALWPHSPPVSLREEAAQFVASLAPTSRLVYESISFHAIHSDELARKCGLTPMELSAILLDLELRGRVQALPGHHYIRSRL